MNTSFKRTIWVIVAVIIVLWIIYPRIFKNSSKNANDKTKQKKQTVLVKTIVVKPGLLREMVKTSGALVADEEVDLSFEIAGKVDKIYFKEGVSVKKGEVLVKLNDDDLTAQMAKLQLQNKLLLEKVNRQKVLLEKEAISQESYDQMITDLQTNEAEMKLLKVRKDKAVLLAPIDGIIGLRYISEGAYVVPGTRIAQLIKNQPLKIEFSIPEKYSELVHPGYALFFKTENNLENEATVYAIEPTIDFKTKTILLRALYPNLNNKLKPGRYVSVELIIREKKNALQVPTECIIPELGREKIFVIKDGKAHGVTVTTGLRTENSIEVTTGISEGDSIVVSGMMQPQEETPVTINK